MGMQNIVGHNSIKENLCNSISRGQINHAYIFEGIAGVGRLSLAKAFAEEIVGCSDKMTSDSHPDIIVVTNKLYDPSKESLKLSVNTIRAMKADVYIKPYLSERKVYIIPNADSMEAVAQNSLLKVFEEPPEYCTIILLVSNSNSLLSTILSRAALIRFQPLETQEVEAFLIKEKGIDEASAKTLAVMSDGSIGVALELLDDKDKIKLRDDTILHLVNICQGKYKPLYDFIKFLKQNEAAFGFIQKIMLNWTNDILHAKMGIIDVCPILNKDKEAQLKAVSSQITREAAFRLGESVTKYSLAISKNVKYSIAVQCMATEYWEEIHGRNYRSAL